MIVGASAQNPEHVIYGLCSSYRSTEGGKGWYRNTAIGGYLKQKGMHPPLPNKVSCGNETEGFTARRIKKFPDFFASPGQDRPFGFYFTDYLGVVLGLNTKNIAGW